MFGPQKTLHLVASRRYARPMFKCLAVVALLAALTACSTSSGESAGNDDAPKVSKKKDSCIELDKAAIKAIAEGLTKKATIVRGYAVKRPASQVDFNLRYIAALEIKDASGKSTAMLAMGGPKAGDGPLVAADNFAQLYLNWGSAAKDGSPIKKAADSAWLSEAGNEAKGCL